MRGRDDALGDGFDDLLVDFVDGEVTFNEDNAVGLPCGDLSILFPDAAKESIPLGFKAIFIAAGFGFHAVVAATRRHPEAAALMRELNAIGNNLNQIARHLNSTGELRAYDDLPAVLNQHKRAIARVLDL